MKELIDEVLLPSSDVAILGILHESEVDYNRYLTGKDINLVIDMAQYHYWVDLKFSTVYNCLKRLEEQGFVIGEYETRNKRRIRLFRITEKGRDILKDEIRKRLIIPIRTKNELDLGIKNILILPKKTIIDLLEDYLKKLEEMIKYYEKMTIGLENAKPGDLIEHIPVNEHNLNKIPIVQALFERPYREQLARKEWLKKFINNIKIGKIKWK